MLRPGDEFAGFRIGRLLGAGGMGEVYEAEHLRLGRVDVLKVLREEVADPAMRTRFLREAQYAARLQHPNVVAIYGAGEAEGHLFLHLQRIEGPNLRELIDQQGPLHPVRALALLAGVADALDAAHASGLVHRDVKPSNILVAPPSGSRPEQAYLTDFGISLLVGQTSLTHSGMLVGTFGYLPPELLVGGSPDARTDVYSLGRVLEEAVSGVRPGEPDGSAAPISPPLRQVIDRACAPEPGNRFPSCGELARAAWAVTTQPPTVHYAPTPPPRYTGSHARDGGLRRRLPGRRRGRLLLGAVLGVAVVAVAIVVGVSLSSGSPTYLDQLSPTQVSGGAAPQLGLVKLGGVQYPHGLSFPAVSGEVSASYAVPKGDSSLSLRPGFDDDQGRASYQGSSADFTVTVDGHVVAKESQVVGSPPPAPITVSVSGHTTATLTITFTNGEGTVDWADPYFE